MCRLCHDGVMKAPKCDIDNDMNENQEGSSITILKKKITFSLKFKKILHKK